MKKFHVSRAFVAALVGIIAVPTVMTSLYTRSMSLNEIRERATGDVRRVRDLRRDYWEAIATYNDLREIGFDDFELIPPDINDPESIAFYLDSTNFVGLHSAAPTVSARDEYNELSERYRDFLDGYISAGYCPDTLKQFHLSGFYELCTRLLDNRTTTIQPNLVERSELMRRSSYSIRGTSTGPTLKDRLRALESTLLQSRNGGVLRPMGTTGQRRPRLDIVE